MQRLILRELKHQSIHPRTRVWCVLCLLATSLFFICFVLLAGTSSADSPNILGRLAGIAGIDRQAVTEVTRAPTLFSRVNEVTFLSRKEVYEYLLDHPDVAAAVGRALKLAEYQITKLGRGAYWATDGDGVAGRFWVIHSERNERIFFLDGTYAKRWLPTIPAQAVLILGFEHRTDGTQSYVDNNIDAYLKIDNALIAFLARLIHSTVGSAMEKKMTRTLELAAQISEEAYRDPDGFLKELAASIELPRQILNELREKVYAP